MADSQSIEQRAKTVPFVGWSYAAANFRRLAATYAPGKAPVLLLGPVGVGKETMAKAWQHVAGASNETLPIVDLDPRMDRDPPNLDIPYPCIATSSKPLPYRLSAMNLDTNSLEHPYYSDKQKPLPKEIAGSFKLRLYMCPLWSRKVDILALLHYFNKIMLPKLSDGCSYERIGPKLLADMLWHQTWDAANAFELLTNMTTMAAKDSQSFGNREGKNLTNLGECRFNPDIHVVTRSDEATLFDEVTLFDGLQSVAIRLFWLCMARYVGEGAEYECLIFDYSDVVWPEWPEKFPREKWYGNCPNADDFCQLTIEQFARVLIDRFCPLMAGAHLAKKSADVCDYMKTDTLGFGSFASLQEGFAVDLEKVASIIASVKSKKNERKANIKKDSGEMKDVEREYWKLSREGLSNNAIALRKNVSKQYVSAVLKSAEKKRLIQDARTRSVGTDEMTLDSDGQPIVSASPKGGGRRVSKRKRTRDDE